MYVSDWDRLGMGPTRDLIAIKKAYALRLRVTRPDDDAEAYQALREAYERAQHWARHTVDEDEDDEEFVDERAGERAAPPATTEPAFVDVQPESVHDTALAPVAFAPDAAPEPEASLELDLEPEPEAWTGIPADETPEALVGQSYQQWHDGGEAALSAAWPGIEAALSRLPLSYCAEASARFADLVISVTDLPHSYVRRLQEHFGWLGDFRIDRMIGPARAEALRQALADVCPPMVTDAQVLHHYADVSRLHQLLQGRWRVHAWLHAALVGWPLQRRMLEAGPRLLRGLGIDIADQSKLGAALEVALWWRVFAMVALLYGSCALTVRSGWVDAAATLGIAVAAAVGGLGAMLIVGSKVSSAFNGGVRWADSIARWLQRGRNHRRGPWIGLGAMALSLVFYGWAKDHAAPLWPWLGGSTLVVLAMALCWPARADLGVVTAGTWGFLMVCLMRVAPSAGWFWLTFGLAGLPTLVAVLYAEGRWRLPANKWVWYLGVVGTVQLLRFSGSTTGKDAAALWFMVTLLAVVAPLMTLARTDRDGYRSALVPMALAGGVVLAADEAARGPWLLIAWPVAIGIVILLQRVAEWLDRRWYGKRAAN